jgi:hypothetical protein
MPIRIDMKETIEKNWVVDWDLRYEGGKINKFWVGTL